MKGRRSSPRHTPAMSQRDLSEVSLFSRTTGAVGRPTCGMQLPPPSRAALRGKKHTRAGGQAALCSPALFAFKTLILSLALALSAFFFIKLHPVFVLNDFFHFCSRRRRGAGRSSETRFALTALHLPSDEISIVLSRKDVLICLFTSVLLLCLWCWHSNLI